MTVSLDGLVDQCRMFVQPVSLGAGTPYFPPNQRLALELVDERRFRSGVVYLAFATRRKKSLTERDAGRRLPERAEPRS